MKKKALFFFIAVIIAKTAVGQDTIKSFDSSTRHIWIGHHAPQLRDKFIECDSNGGSYISDLLSQIPGAARKDCDVTIPESFGLIHNTFFKGHNPNPVLCSPQSARIVVPQSANINFSRFDVSLQFTISAQNLYLEYDTIKDLFMVNVNTNHIEVAHCVSENNNLSLLNVTSQQLGVYDNKLTNKSQPDAWVSLINSNIGTFVCASNQCSSLYIALKSDTFTKSIEISDRNITWKNAPSYRQTSFSDCHIDSRFFLDSLFGNSFNSVSFSSCTFGKNAGLTIVSVDTIEFSNCLNIVDEIPLVINNTKDVTYLKVSNSNISNLQFDYLGSVKLYIWKDNDELNKSNFENLISKFEKEKKKESLKNITIEYYIYSHNAIICFINWVWWYYGYRRWLVFIWTLGFLLTFTCINLVFWAGIKSTYPIIESEPDLAPEYRDLNLP